MARPIQMWLLLPSLTCYTVSSSKVSTPWILHTLERDSLSAYFGLLHLNLCTTLSLLGFSSLEYVHLSIVCETFILVQDLSDLRPVEGLLICSHNWFCRYRAVQPDTEVQDIISSSLWCCQRSSLQGRAPVSPSVWGVCPRPAFFGLLSTALFVLTVPRCL